jgi:hypothetical protein
MPHTIKEGDARTLRWDLGRDLTGVTAARVIISVRAGDTPAIDRDGTIDDPPTTGIVSLTLGPDDYSTTKLSVHGRDHMTYQVEIETQPGPLTHPDNGYETLTVLADLG